MGHNNLLARSFVLISEGSNYWVFELTGVDCITRTQNPTLKKFSTFRILSIFYNFAKFHGNEYLKQIMATFRMVTGELKSVARCRLLPITLLPTISDGFS